MTIHLRRNPAGRHRRTIFAVAAAVAITLAVTAGCSGPRSGVSAISDVSSCAAVLPLAHDIVHASGTLTLVRRINKDQVDTLTRELGATAPPPAAHRTPLRSAIHVFGGLRTPKECLVVYRGVYPRGTIAGASPPAVAGRYALLVLRVRHPAVDRIFVTDTLPAAVRL
ncbi:MAG TPA: hypothetical protein VGJ13_09000 [Pseudonocardiaceae bacterium]|jgi:hypothetical protein